MDLFASRDFTSARFVMLKAKALSRCEIPHLDEFLHCLDHFLASLDAKVAIVHRALVQTRKTHSDRVEAHSFRDLM